VDVAAPLSRKAFGLALIRPEARAESPKLRTTNGMPAKSRRVE
jgi:hypothetical protein